MLVVYKSDISKSYIRHLKNWFPQRTQSAQRNYCFNSLW